MKKTETNKKIKEEIRIDDVWDIFWEEPIKNKEIIENVSDNLTSSIFNKKELIKNLKELKVKWALTMGILWSDCYNNWTVLEIKLKTAFALKQINTNENLALINQALEKMNMWEIQVKLK